MYIVKTRFFEGVGPARRPAYYSRENGPFADRDLAEQFAANIATHPDFAEVKIEIEEAEDNG